MRGSFVLAAIEEIKRQWRRAEASAGSRTSKAVGPHGEAAASRLAQPLGCAVERCM